MESTRSHTPRHPRLSLAGRAGYSVMELVILIALMGILAAIAVTSIGNQPVSVRDAKLASDVATLNQMVALYIADGGDDSMKAATNPQAVLDRLKRIRPQSEWNQHTGPASGRLIDVRLRARVTTVAERNGQQRAKWNLQQRRFELITSGGSAVSEFYLDEALAGSDPGSEKRTASTVKYNVATEGKNQGWVWGYNSPGNFAYNNAGGNQGEGSSNPFDPSSAPPVNPGDPGDENGGTPGGGTGTPGEPTDPGPTIPVVANLPRPSILPGGGTYAYSTFPGQVLISPGNIPENGSVLEYRINGGGWQSYVGSPISVSPSDKIDARNRSTDTALYRNSSNASATFYRLVSGFSGSGTGTWGNATGGANLFTTYQNGSGSSTFKHGNTKLDLGGGIYLDAGVENVLTFTPGTFDTIVPNAWFDLGELMMLNGTTFYNSEANGVTLSININLSEPAQAAVVHINLGLISTENTSDRLASADIVELRNPNTNFKVTVDGVEYGLELGWETLDPGAGVVKGNQFLVFETASASAVLRGRFVSNR